MKLIEIIKSFSKGRRLDYILVMDMGASFLRCLYSERVVFKKKSYQKGYHLGKAYAYFYLLEKTGFAMLCSPIGVKTLSDNWAVIKGVYSFDGFPKQFVVKKTLFEDALELIRVNGGPPLRWGKGLVQKIKKELS